jgi:uncharacterized repeat protein (TIGR03806 family)
MSRIPSARRVRAWPAHLCALGLALAAGCGDPAARGAAPDVDGGDADGAPGYRDAERPAPPDAERPAPPDAVSPVPPDVVSPAPSDAVSPALSDAVSPAPSDAVSPAPPDALAPSPRDAVPSAPPDAVAPSPPDAVPPAPPDAARPVPPDAAPLAVSPLSPRIENRTCRFPPAPPAGPLTVAEAFPALDFTAPVWLGHAGTGERRLFVAQQGGLILSFEPHEDADAADVFLRVETRANGELGLLGLAFHPNHAENGLFYVFSSRENPTRSRLSEFRRLPGGGPPIADPASERVLLEFEKPFGNHNGGDLHFGPDGYLYVAIGDGGSAGDPQNHAQRPETLLGSILRIDVDRRDPGLEYAVPADNPFAACSPACGALGAARPEIWAYGLRNPWRMSFDAPTGRLFAGDVGQNAWEEVDLIRRGENYGWRRLEGNHCFEAPDCDPAGTTPPVHEYPRAEGQSIIGGRVYRGGAFPELWGAYVFGDHRSGRLWALREVDGRAQDVTLLADTDLQLTSFGVDTDETLYLTAYTPGRSLWRLARPADAPPAEPLPARLSDTGCFSDAGTHALAPGVIPYGVQSPLFSDGALKRRAFALPEGGQFEYRDGQSWDAPVGTVVLKTFGFPTPEGIERRVETRVMVRWPEGWVGYTYRWRADQSDADLLPGAAEVDVDTPDGPLSWTFPSRAQCDACHTRAAGGLIGLSTAQLNGDFVYPSGRAPQLAALAEAGYVVLPAAPQALDRRVDPTDANAPIAARAEAWLDAQCAHCHRPGANANTALDLRAETPGAARGLCDVTPLQGDLGLAGAPLVAPGDPDGSVLVARLTAPGPGRMPPLGTRRVDPTGEALVRAWIASLGAQGCD